MKRRAIEQWDAAYVRVSTDMQLERDALQNQIQALEAHGAVQGDKLRLYKDEGISAKDTDRADLQRLLADVRAGRVRSVVVTKLDRISRSLADLLDLMRLFEAHGPSSSRCATTSTPPAPSGASRCTSWARSPSWSAPSPPSGWPRT